VQGTEAPGEICRAIKAANEHCWADTLIIGRGGGSLEDLVAFNDEAVARAVFASLIPIISAVGHETDFSICDFVADVRAPTPSAAAELATPDHSILKAEFLRSRRQLERRVLDRLQRDTQRLDHAAHRLQQQHPVVRLNEQTRRIESLQAALQRTMKRSLADRSLKLENLEKRLKAVKPDRRIAELSMQLNSALRSLHQAMRTRVRSRHEKLSELARTLNAVSPLETLGRGYAIVTMVDSGEVVSSSARIKPGDRVVTRLKDGEFDSTVDSIKPRKT